MPLCRAVWPLSAPNSVRSEFFFYARCYFGTEMYVFYLNLCILHQLIETEASSCHNISHMFRAPTIAHSAPGPGRRSGSTPVSPADWLLALCRAAKCRQPARRVELRAALFCVPCNDRAVRLPASMVLCSPGGAARGAPSR